MPRWSRWAALSWVIFMVLSYFSPPSWQINQGGAGSTDYSGLLFPLGVLSFFVSVVISQVYRYRRVSTPAQRQQTKWVVYGFAAAFGGLALNILVVGPLISSNALLSVLISVFLFYFVLLLLPLSIGLAILSHHLWDIIINRTIVYRASSACVVGLYVLVVGYLGALFRTESNLLTL